MGGGTIYIETPNVQSLGHDRSGRFWRDLDVPRHLILFNLQSLEKALSDAGFIDIQAHPRPEIFPLIALQSDRIAEGLDPFSDTPVLSKNRAITHPDLPIPVEKCEFLTLTARTPL